jgi:uncharacterized protein YjgD (DUF1641 family)
MSDHDGADGDGPTLEGTDLGGDLEAAIAENPEAVAAFVRRLDAVNELLDVLALGESALDDGMVRELASTGASLGELADTAADDDTREGLETLLAAVGEAERGPPERVGLIGLAKASRDPDLQYGLGYVLALARALGRTRAEAEPTGTDA